MKLYVSILSILSLVFIQSGCTDKATTEQMQIAQQDIMKSQQEILTKLTELEKKVQAAPAARARPQIDYNKVHIIPLGNSSVKGKLDARVTIVEFSDFQCPYCSRLQPTLAQVTEAYPNDVKLVFKHFPLTMHKQAKNAAKAAEAAREQGKFWEMHDVIFANFNKLNPNSYQGFATQIGLDVEKFKADFASNRYDQIIQDDIKVGRSLGVSGTPSLFLNGKRMQQRSFEDFKESIESHLEKKAST